MPPKSKAAKAKDAKAKAATAAKTLSSSASTDSISSQSASASSSATSATSSASTAEKPQAKESYRNCTGVLISQPRALDVKIGGFTLAAYGKELIKDTQIEFTIGRRYGLIGSNGSGKSAFLKCQITTQHRQQTLASRVSVTQITCDGCYTDSLLSIRLLCSMYLGLAEREVPIPDHIDIFLLEEGGGSRGEDAH